MNGGKLPAKKVTNLDWGDARSFCNVSASVGAVDDALLDGLLRKH